MGKYLTEGNSTRKVKYQFSTCIGKILAFSVK